MCGADCADRSGGDCGWNSDTMDCELGKVTQPNELTMGDCPTSGSPTTGGIVDGSSQESGDEPALAAGVTIGFGALSVVALCGMVAVFWHFKRKAQTERRSMHRVKALTVQAEVAEARKKMSFGEHGLGRSFSVTSNPYFPGPQGNNNQRPLFYEDPGDPTYETIPGERRHSAEHLYAQVDNIDADVAGYVKPELVGACEVNPSKPASGVGADSPMLYEAPEALEFGRPDGDDLYADFGVSSAPDFVPKKTFGRGPNQAVHTTAPNAAVTTKGAATVLPDGDFGFGDECDV